MWWNMLCQLLLSIRWPSARRRRPTLPWRRLAFRPQLEALETLVLPDAVSWASQVNGDWAETAKWTPHAPMPGDNVTIGYNVMVTHSGGADAVSSLYLLAGTLAFTGGSLTTGTVLASGTLNLSGGSLIAATVSGSGTLNLSGGTLFNAAVAVGTTLTGTTSGGTLNNVTLNGNLDLMTNNGARVSVSSSLTVNGTIFVGRADGSTHGTVTLNDSASIGGTGAIRFGASASNALIGGTISHSPTTSAALDLSTNRGAQMTVTGAVTLAHDLQLNQSTVFIGDSGGTLAGQLLFQGNRQLNGSGTIVFSAFNSTSNGNQLSGSTLDIGSGISIRGKNGQVRGFTNYGNITADVPGGGIGLYGNWQNSGTIQAVNGGIDLGGVWTNAASGTIQSSASAGSLGVGGTWVNNGTILAAGGLNVLGLAGTWTNNGRIEVDGTTQNSAVWIGQVPFSDMYNPWSNAGQIVMTSAARIDLGGRFHTADFRGIQCQGCSYFLDGIWDNSGQTANFDSQTGPLSVTNNFSGSTMLNGTWNFAAGTNLIFLRGGTMDGTTINGSVVVDGHVGIDGFLPSVVNVRHDLTLNGSITTTEKDTETPTPISFSGSQTLSGMADVRLVGNNQGPATLEVAGNTGSVLTIAPTVLIHGQNGSVSADAGTSFLNQGTIAADEAGATLTVQGSWTNDTLGHITADAPGGTLNLQGTWINNGMMEASNQGTVNLQNTWTNEGILTAQAGGTLAGQTAPTNYADGTLTGGTWQVFDTGTLELFLDAGLVTNDATIILDGPNSHFYLDANGTDALADFAHNDVNGSFTMRNGRDVNLVVDFTNSGIFIVGSNSALTTNAFFTEDPQSGSLVIQTTGLVDLSGYFTNFTLGTLTGGTYQIAGTLRFAGNGLFTNAANLTLDGSAAQVVDPLGNDQMVYLSDNAAGASLAVQNGYILSPIQGLITNDGALTVGPNSSFTAPASFNQSSTGTLIIVADGVVGLIGSGNLDGSVSNSGTLVIGDGNVIAGVLMTGTFLQAGSLYINDHATFAVTGSFANFADHTLTGGFYDILGTFQFNNAAIATNAATLILDGPDAFVSDENGNDAFADFVLNTGSFTLQNGSAEATAGDFQNAGSLALGAGSSFTVGGNYIQTGGMTLLAGGTLSAGGGLVDLQGGTLSGSGTINASVQNEAEIDVGGAGAAGLLAIKGDFTQTSAGVLNLEVGGYNPGTDFDQLAISGQANLDGTLNVSLLNGFVPRSGDSFQVLTAGAVNGVFAGGTIDPPFGSPQYDPMDLMLVAQ